MLGKMARGRVVPVAGIYVDRAVLEARFACVPGRCAPRRGRGRALSCCADLEVALSPAEARALAKERSSLRDWLVAREPRLAPVPELPGPDSTALARPGGRCVFSALGEDGAILCHLHAWAGSTGRDRRAVQPLPCQLFPLILLDLGEGRVGLTVVARDTARRVGTPPPTRHPCRADPELPPLVVAMRDDIAALLGEDVAAGLVELAGA
jgi:hypothetical protein